VEGRWYIYKEGRSEGPMTAAEIRDGLRDGSFDPFDLVAREGSNVRVELVEVDEIFMNSKVVYGEGAAEARALPPGAAAALGEELEGGAIPAQGEHTRPNNKSADVRMGNGHLALADDSVGKASGGQPRSFHPSYAPGGGSGYHVGGDSGLQQQRNRREPKSYHVMDGRGRVLGPVSAREIQALFFKGVLDKSVVVMKNGSRSRVRVDKFVAVYSQQRGGRPSGPGGGEVAGAAHPAVQGPLQVGRLTTHQIMKAAYLEREKLTLLAYLLSALLIVLAGLVLWRSGGEGWFAKAMNGGEDRRERLDEPTGQSRPRPKLKPKKAPKVKLSKKREDRKARAARLEREAERRRETAKEREAERRAEKRKKEREKKRLAEERREERLTAQRAEERRRRQLAERRKQEVEKRRLEARRRIDAEWRNRERLEALRKQREAVKAKLAKKTNASKAKPAAAPAPQPAKASKPTGPQVAALADGQQVSRLGPMSFNRAQVEGCEAACSVTFSGASGTVTAKFFKTVWGPTLLSKSGSVYLTGLVRKSGGSTTIILSNIQ
jgi:hypothetical protein